MPKPPPKATPGDRSGQGEGVGDGSGDGSGDGDGDGVDDMDGDGGGVEDVDDVGMDEIGRLQELCARHDPSERPTFQVRHASCVMRYSSFKLSRSWFKLLVST